MKVKIAIVQSSDGHLTCVGPNDFKDGDHPDAMSAAVCYHLEAGHTPVGHYWAEVDLPALPKIPVVTGRVNDVGVPLSDEEIASRAVDENQASTQGFACALSALKIARDGETKPAGRARPPQDMGRWPPSMTQEQVEEAIDQYCGCGGRFACDCVACFSHLRTTAWGIHNGKTPMERLVEDTKVAYSGKDF